MNCPQCQAENAADAVVCLFCGAPLPSGAESARSSVSDESPTDSALRPTTTANEAPVINESNPTASAPRRRRVYADDFDVGNLSLYITQPSGKLSRVEQIEIQMSMVVAGFLVGGIALSVFAVYLFMPEDENLFMRAHVAALMEDTKREPMQETAAETAGQEAGTAALAEITPTEDVQKADIPEENAPAAERPAAEEETPEPKETETPSKPKKESPTEIAQAESSPSVATPAPPAPPMTVAVIGPSPAPAIADETDRAKKIPVVERSIVSDRPLKRSSSGCGSQEDAGHCAPQYVVTFKRFWGSVLEERVYPSREMMQRAQLLWEREGKILEADGSINDTYVVKRKTFTPIPGHPVS